MTDARSSPTRSGCHEAFADAAFGIAIADSDSPFVQRDVTYDSLTQQEDHFTNDRCTAAGAAAEMKSRIAERIALVLEKKPKLRPLYDERLELQNMIDERRAAGSKVPLAWIQNLFHRKSHVFKGWAE